MEGLQDDHEENVDLAELEVRLYSKVHHDAVDKNDTAIMNLASDKTLSCNQMANSATFVSMSHKKAPPHSQSQIKSKASMHSFTFSTPKHFQDRQPKPFSPYTSCLPQSMTNSSMLNVHAENEQSIDIGNVDITTVKSIQEKLVSQKKNTKKRATNKMLNPFNRLNEIKSKQQQEMLIKKQRAENVRQKNQKKIDTVVLDSSSEGEKSDDDVIILPQQPQPIFSIDDSSDEEEKGKISENDSVNNQINQRPQSPSNSDDFIEQHDRFRVSPTGNEIFAGIDDEELDFINESVGSAQKSSITISALSGLSDQQNEVDQSKHPRFINFVKSSDLSANTTSNLEVSCTVDSNQITSLNESESDAILFVKPSNQLGDHEKSYEVQDNSIAAIDVYESESSDLPESVYKKGHSKSCPASVENIRKDSDSDVDIQINTINRPKRLTKRKGSGSNKESDHIDDSDDDKDDDNGSDNSYPCNTEGNSSHDKVSFIVRGEAVGNAMSKLRKSKPKVTPKRKRTSAKSLSDDEFISMLSCIVHGEPPDNKESAEKSTETETQSMEKSNQKSSEKQHSKWTVTDVTSSVNQSEDLCNTSDTQMVITDEIGEIDECDFPINIQLNVSHECDKTTENEKDNFELAIEKGKDEIQCVRSCSLVVHPEMGWNEEMYTFYYKSWGGETYNVREIQSSMPNELGEWTILPEDQYLPIVQINKSIRCVNCREIGHRTNRCDLPPREITCYMCGQKGHREARCPNAICLRCGFKSKVFIQGCIRCANSKGINCGLCRSNGHPARDCPDKWRRYHSTIEPNTSLVKLQPINKLPISRNKPNMYCCVCAGRGHLAEYCRSALHLRDTQIPPMKIHSYEQSYTPTDSRNKSSTPRYSLMSVPQKNFQFNWEVNEDPRRFYGRFLKNTNFKREMNEPSQSTDEKSVQQPKKQKKSGEMKKSRKYLVLNPLSNVVARDLESIDHRSGPVKLVKNIFASKSGLIIEEKSEKAPEVVIDSPITSTIDANLPVASNVIADNNLESEENVDNLIKKNSPNHLIMGESDLNPNRQNYRSINSDLTYSKSQNIPKQNESNSITNMDRSEPNEKISRIEFSFREAFENLEKTRNNFDLSFIGKMNERRIENNYQWKHSQQFYARNGPPNKMQNCMHNNPMTFNWQYPFVEILKPTPAEYNKSSTTNRNIRYTIGRNPRYPQNHDHPIRPIASTVLQKNTATGRSITPDTDSNYSFSEFFPDIVNEEHQRSQIDRITRFEDGICMPDFIPLSNQNILNRTESRISTAVSSTISLQSEVPNPIQMPNPIELNENCSAKIYLTKEFCKYLLNAKGSEFLREQTVKHKITVNMEYSSLGNNLNIYGLPSNQEDFQKELTDFCQEMEKDVREKSEISSKVPKNRLSLIKFIRDQIIQLDRSLGDVENLYFQMRVNERLNTKQSTKNANKVRQTLNMILMGQAGLREGKSHLISLLNNLRCLHESTRDVVSVNFRNQVFQHCRYIFSSFQHDEYPTLIHEYETLRKSGELPVLNFDRKLLGFKMNVINNQHNEIAASNTEIPAINLSDDCVKNEIETQTETTSEDHNIKNLDGKDDIKANFENAKLKLKNSIKEEKLLHISVQSDANPTMNEDIDLDNLKLPETKSSEDTVEVIMKCESILDDIIVNKRSSKRDGTQMSAFWSNRCAMYLDKCKKNPKLKSSRTHMKLNNITRKALTNRLSYVDYRNLMSFIRLIN